MRAERRHFTAAKKKLFENGMLALDANPTGPVRPSAEARKIETLEAKLQHKNEVMAELMGEHVA